MEPNLSVEICGKTFSNPILIASATPSRNADYIKRCVDAGAGGIVAKTVTDEQKLQSSVSPRFTILHKNGWPHVFSNYSCELMSSYTPSDWMGELRTAADYCQRNNVVLIGSIAGSTIDVWVKLAREIEDTGIDMLEMNFGSPHLVDFGYKSSQELGSNPDAAVEVVAKVVDNVSIPVFAKITAEAVDPVYMARKVQEAGASGVTALNRFPALDLDLDTGRPLLHSTFAGVNGPWMRPILLKWIAKIAREVDIPVSATNGIWGWEDIVKAIMVGASTVQICTAVMYSPKGLGIIREFIQGLEQYMRSKGYQSVQEMWGISLGQILAWDEIDIESRAVSVVQQEFCTGCQECMQWCFYGAVSYRKINGATKAFIDRGKCDGCGLCACLCRQEAIRMEGLSPIYLGDFR